MTAYDELPDDIKINTPPHYNSHPSGIEIIEITRLLGFALGNAVKYVARHGEKENALLDLGKGQWYLNDAVDTALLTVPPVAARKLLALATYDEHSGDPETGELTGEFYRAVAAFAEPVHYPRRALNALAVLIHAVEQQTPAPAEPELELSLEL